KKDFVFTFLRPRSASTKLRVPTRIYKGGPPFVCPDSSLTVRRQSDLRVKKITQTAPRSLCGPGHSGLGGFEGVRGHGRRGYANKSRLTYLHNSPASLGVPYGLAVSNGGLFYFPGNFD